MLGRMFFVSAPVALAGTLAGAAQADTHLTYGSTLPAPHLAHHAALEPFFKRVADATDGVVTWEILPGGTMGGVKEVVQMLRDNVTDSGLILDLFVRQELPVTSTISDLITLPDDFIVYGAAANEFQLVACPGCVAERTAQNIVGLAYYGPDPYRLMCRDGTRSFADLQSKKTRATGRLGVLMQEFGATTVTIPSSEVYESLQRGQADCTAASTAWLDSYNLKDVVKTVIDLPMGSFFNANIMSMNADVYHGLSESERAAINSNLAGLVVDVMYAYKKEGDAGLENAVAAGVELVQPDEEFLAALETFRKGEVENTIATAEAAGVKNPREMVETYLSLVEKWRGILAEIGENDREAFIAALDREVFSKAKF
ncbi:MAG: C4-dicarboxylate TRAP transporter substrate-binding protein [Paracoccaceae bacterium]